MSYRQEATTRIAYFTAIAVFAAAVGLGIGALIANSFHSSHISHNRLLADASFVAFVIICSPLVYWVDQTLNKRFDKNP